MDKELFGTLKVIAVSEVFASMALHTLRLKSELEVGFDMSVKFAEEGCSFENYIYFIFAFLAAFLGWLSDSYVGKFYIVLAGMAITLLALILFLMPVDLHPITIQWQRWKTISGVLLLVYVSTSGIRNAFILEQFPIAADDQNMMRFYTYIFAFMLIRSTVRLVPHGFKIVGMNGDIANTVLIIIASLSAVTYLAWLFLASKEFFIESTYIGIWTKCIFCYIGSFMNRNRSSKTNINYEEGFFIDEPKSNISLWGYRGIFDKDNVLKKISDLKKKGSDQSMVTHALFSVKPFFSEYVIWQTIGLRSIIILLAPGFLMGHFIYVLISYLHNLSKHTVEVKNFQHLSLSVYELTTIFDILSSLIQLLFLPVLLKAKDLTVVIISYLLLFCSAGTIYAILFYPGFNYFECNTERWTSSLRFYNSLLTRTNISSDWFDEVEIPTLANVLLPNVDVNSESETREIEVKNKAEKIDYRGEIEIFERATTSYVILPGGVFMNSKKDPSICDYNRRLTNASWFFLVSGIRNPFLKIVVQSFETNETIAQLTLDSTEVFEVPSNKRLTVSFERLWRENVTINIEEALRSASMYSLFVYEKPKKTLYADFVYLEGPLFLPFYLISVPVVFISAANTFASVAYYRFILIESPEKLRGSIFSFIVALNFLSIGLTKSFSYNFDWIYITTATSVHLILFIVLAVFMKRYKYKLVTYYGSEGEKTPK